MFNRQITQFIKIILQIRTEKQHNLLRRNITDTAKGRPSPADKPSSNNSL
jgi:hypothetical protein